MNRVSLRSLLPGLLMLIWAVSNPWGSAKIFAAADSISTASGIYNVRAYGAVGNGKHLDSPAINRAIAAAAKAGGGTVEVPAGTYLCGSIHLKSNINLHLDSGATILGAPQSMHAYDKPEVFVGTAYQDGGHTYFHNSLIWGVGLHNVAITGMGEINGGGLIRYDKGVNHGAVDMGDKAIALKLCSHVLLQNITIFHGGHFGVLATGCDLLTLNNLIIDTDRDGVDIDACRNVCVSNCRINSPNDDGLCLKSTDALHRIQPTENVVITNCQVSGFKEGTLLNGKMILSSHRYGYGRIKLGTESDGGFKNITISNCTFYDCMGLAIEEVDGGILQNVTISNIAMYDVRICPIYITLGDRNRAPPPVHTGQLKHILISNIIAENVSPESGIQITGLPGHDVKDIRLSNIRLMYRGGGTKKDALRVPPELGHKYPGPRHLGIMPAYGLFIRHAKNISLSNIKVTYKKTDYRPAVVCDDVNGLRINHLHAELAKGVVGGRFTAVSGLKIRNSPVLHGAKGK